jgi:uncharacterized protein (TIGR00369 family)
VLVAGARQSARYEPRYLFDPVRGPGIALGGADYRFWRPSRQREGRAHNPRTSSGTFELNSDHHTPWGIVHGGVYSTAVESAASIGASAVVRDQDQVAVGLTNTTHFLRSVTSGRVQVEAEAVYQGRTHQLWRADITDESGRLIAHGEVRLQNIQARLPQSTGG